MARFRYRAKTSQGETVSGVLAGESREAVLGRLEGQELFPIEIAPALPSVEDRGWSGLAGRLRPQHITEVYRQLSDLLEAGVPLLAALAGIGAQSSRPAHSALLAALEADVAEGGALATAFARHPGHFSSLEVNMVQAAEAGGFLPGALARIAGFREKREALVSRARTALAYPLAVLTVGLAAVTLLLVWVVPRFELMFAQMQGVLPLPTQMLLGMSRWVSSYWVLLAAVVVLGVVAYRRFRETTRGRELVDRITLRLPLVGGLATQSGVARISRTLGLLLGGGVPVLRSLAIASGGAGNVILKRAVEACAESVREGESLAEPLRATGVIPATVVEMIAVGEQSAKLPAVLERIADSFDARVDRTLTVLVSLLTPALILLLAGLVGFVVLALLLPIFTLSSLVQ